MAIPIIHHSPPKNFVFPKFWQFIASSLIVASFAFNISGCSPLKVERVQQMTDSELFSAYRHQRASAEQWKGGLAADAANESIKVIKTEIERRYVDAPYETRMALISGQPAIGMSKEQVLMVWGKPHDINRTQSKYGSSEQWVYNENVGRGFSLPKRFIYFERDLVTAIQD